MRFLLSLLSTNLKAALALRGAFTLQVVFMLLNNLMMFIFWWILFERFDSIRGWRLDDVAVLFAVAASGYGIAAVFAGGLYDLSRRIDDGDLDPMLTLPRSVLVQAAAARTRSDGWGDVLSGFVLLGLSCYGDLSRLPIYLVAVLISAVMVVASQILIHCAAFWLGRVEAIARQACDFMLTFSTYPPVLFGGALKIVLFTVLPAGFVGYLPAELVRDFDPTTLALALFGALAYATAAWWVFHRGLRRYASGSRFGVRA